MYQDIFQACIVEENLFKIFIQNNEATGFILLERKLPDSAGGEVEFSRNLISASAGEHSLECVCQDV